MAFFLSRHFIYAVLIHLQLYLIFSMTGFFFLKKERVAFGRSFCCLSFPFSIWCNICVSLCVCVFVQFAENIFIINILLMRLNITDHDSSHFYSHRRRSFWAMPFVWFVDCQIPFNTSHACWILFWHFIFAHRYRILDIYHLGERRNSHSHATKCLQIDDRRYQHH